MKETQETKVQSLSWEVSPWRRKWQPAPVLLPEKFHGRRNLVDFSPWGCKESDMTEHVCACVCTQTHTHTHTHTQLIHNIVLVSGPQHNDSVIQQPYFKNTGVPTWPEMFRKGLKFWYLQRLQISTLHLPESRVTQRLKAPFVCVVNSRCCKATSHTPAKYYQNNYSCPRLRSVYHSELCHRPCGDGLVSASAEPGSRVINHPRLTER